MNIVDFYKELSLILEEARERTISKKIASDRLDELLKKASDSKLDVEVSKEILNDETLNSLDDEKSFSEPEYYEEDSYESSYEESYESSYDEE